MSSEVNSFASSGLESIVLIETSYSFNSISAVSNFSPNFSFISLISLNLFKNSEILLIRSEDNSL